MSVTPVNDAGDGNGDQTDGPRDHTDRDAAEHDGRDAGDRKNRAGQVPVFR
jgi:hypothetical protein